MEDPCALVRDTSEWVVTQANSVSISQQAVDDLVNGVGGHLTDLEDLYTLKSFDRDLHYADPSNPSLTAQYLLVVDAINFCFWQDDELEYADLAGGIKQSILKNPDAISAESLARMDEEGVQNLLNWPRAVPLAAERARLLRELGANLAANFSGQAQELILSANGSASELVTLITRHFPGFRDHCIYKGRQVFFYKRAQILVGDLYGAFQGQGLGSFTDIGRLTMFADYRVPAVLREVGVLCYAPTLEHRIDSLEELPPGSEEEIEIRAATVVAIERIRTAVGNKVGNGLAGKKKGPPSVHLDWALWEIGEAQRAQHRPHHRTLTVYY